MDRGTAPRQREEIANRFVVRAAGLAPSVHNTQPWYFTSDQGVISLYADPSRGLPEEDPAGRELVISCGAALGNLTLAVRHLGFTANVRLLPDISRRGLLSEVRWGRYAAPTPYEELLYRSIGRRHTHRGPFAGELPPLVADELVRVARHERADLHVIYNADRQADLANLVALAEQAQRDDPRIAAEREHWARLRGDSRPDGVPVVPVPCRWDGPGFAGRDLSPAAETGSVSLYSPDEPREAGLVALLSTRDDRRPGWLLAGQALQRLLLHAAARGVGSAFHTQPLEIPEIREWIRADFTGGAYPQVLLRFGCGGYPVKSPRRPVSEFLDVSGR